MGLFDKLFGKKNTPAPDPAPQKQKNLSEILSEQMGVPIYMPSPDDIKTESPISDPVDSQKAIDVYLKDHPEAKRFKLSGKSDDFVTASAGDSCEIEEDFETEKYQVICGVDVLGYLPSSAVKLAEKYNISPLSLKVIVAEVDYDMEKSRDIYYVYVD